MYNPIFSLFDKHIPARGRKLSLLLSLIPNFLKRFDKHIPARGRKQCGRVRKQRCSHYLTNTSPQGDGNFPLGGQTATFTHLTNTSPQGDGNPSSHEVPLHDSSSQFDKHIPARGRKPACTSAANTQTSVFDKHIPARGRKPPQYPRVCRPGAP